MNSYEPSIPRAAFGLIAAAMSAITIGALVVLPTKLDSAGPDLLPVAMAASSMPPPIEVVITPARIDVIAAREPNVAWAVSDTARPNCKPEV
jgi:hypothetical protein